MTDDERLKELEEAVHQLAYDVKSLEIRLKQILDHLEEEGERRRYGHACLL